MTKAAAIRAFWSSFGLPAYDELSVPTGKDAPQPPYVTFAHASDGLDASIALSASVWYRSTSPVEVNAKVQEISTAFQDKRKCLLPCDGGAIRFLRGSPFSLLMGDPSDPLIKRAVINYTAHFFTTD